MEKLYDFAPALGVAWVEALFPRSYLDVNRNTTEIDVALFDEPWPDPLETDAKALAKVRLGKGLVWRITDDGVPIYDRRLSVQEVRSRIDRCWRPYHEAVGAAIEAAHARHGYSIHLNCHSMPAVAAVHATDFPGLVHADFVIGDRDGTTADPALSRMVCKHLESLGYNVSYNHPYKGVELVRRYGDPARHRHSIQVEINRRLYMDEQTLELHARLRAPEAKPALAGRAAAGHGSAAKPLMDQVDAIVVGAGAVGLAVARALAQAGLRNHRCRRRRPAIGQGVSSRNSEVIHAGLYYPPGSLKARLCVRGKELLYELCASHGVSHRNCGKLVVANSEAETSALQGLQERAVANGVPVDWLDAAPGPGAGAGSAVRGRLVLDQHGHRGQPWLHAGAAGRPGERRRRGGAGFCRRLGRARARAAARMWSAWPMAARSPRAFSSTAHRCTPAPWHAASTASIRKAVPREYFAKGSYYALAGKAPFTRLVYPAPADAWLGVHLTLDLGGQAKFGPDLEWLDVARPEDIDYTVDPRRADGFYAEVRRYWPRLARRRAATQLQRRAAQDLRPRRDGARLPHRRAGDARRSPGLVNLFGIESPGLTSALAIAEHVVALLGIAGLRPARPVACACCARACARF